MYIYLHTAFQFQFTLGRRPVTVHISSRVPWKSNTVTWNSNTVPNRDHQHQHHTRWLQTKTNELVCFAEFYLTIVVRFQTNETCRLRLRTYHLFCWRFQTWSGTRQPLFGTQPVRRRSGAGQRRTLQWNGWAGGSRPCESSRKLAEVHVGFPFKLTFSFVDNFMFISFSDRFVPPKDPDWCIDALEEYKLVSEIKIDAFISVKFYYVINLMSMWFRNNFLRNQFLHDIKEQFDYEVVLENQELDSVTIDPATLEWHDETIGTSEQTRAYVYVTGTGMEALTHSEFNIFYCLWKSSYYYYISLC